jgi:tRNA A37 threonylcarbamoyladenosine modification protein TsaB
MNAIIDPEKPYLVLDASRMHLQAGVVQGGSWVNFLDGASGGPILSAVEEHLRPILNEHPLSSLSGIIYNQGPGSTLGLRATISMLGAWQVLYGLDLQFFYYGALEYLAAWVRWKHGLSHFGVVTPARPGFYHLCTVEEGRLRIETTPEIQSLPKPLFYLAQSKIWQSEAPFSYQEELVYSIKDLPHLLSQPSEWLVATPIPALSPLMVQPPSYAAWAGERHRKS